MLVGFRPKNLYRYKTIDKVEFASKEIQGSAWPQDRRAIQGFSGCLRNDLGRRGLHTEDDREMVRFTK